MNPPSDFSQATDKELATWLLQGSAAATREFDARFRRSVFTTILRIVRDRAAAEDLTQETLIQVLHTLRTFDTDRPLWPWIYVIAKHKAQDHVEKRENVAKAEDAWLWETQTGKRLREGVPAIDDQPSDPIRVYATAHYDQYLQAIEQLEEPYRQLYKWRELEHRSYDDLAKKLNLTTGTIRGDLTRARQKLEAIFLPMLDITPTPR